MINTTTYYVDANGSDTWSGTLPVATPNGTDGPWATLAHARDVLRTLHKDRPIRVLLRGGVYELAETLIFTPADSGTASAPITYAAFPGERPIVSGGRTITGWVDDTVNDRPCWRVTLPEVAAGQWYFTQLFANAERRPRPRLPKEGFYHFTDVPGGRRAHAWYHGPEQACYAPGHLQHWHNLEDVELVPVLAWYDQHLRITALDEEASLVTFACPALNGLHDEVGDFARYTVENVFEALTEPGEWYLDRPTGTLYYLPKEGETPDAVEIVAPLLERIVKLAGTPDAPVQYLRFENVDFRFADWQLPPENPGAVQAAFIVPGAIRLQFAHHCVFYGCTISRLAQFGIEVQLGCTCNRIVACTFSDLGAGGVKINHERNVEVRATGDEAFAGLDPVALGWAYDGVTEEMLPAMRTEVADCRIHDCGTIFHGAVGVWIGDSGFNHIHHNEIHDLFYTGISCGWSWNYAPTRANGNRIEYNHVYNIGRGFLSDMGAIYLLGLQPGGVVRGNHVHDVSCYGYGGSGIYPDQGSSFLTIEGNIIHHTQSEALSIHYGSGLTVRNNIFALTRSGLMARGREESIIVGLIERNILYGTSPKMLGYYWGNPTTYVANGNLYWTHTGTSPEFFGVPFAEWQRLGQDADGLVADPLFADPEGGDFTLRADSPALALGFQPTGLSAIGPRYAGVLPASIDAVPLLPDDARPMLEARLELGEPTFPMAADAERLTNMPSTVQVCAGEPQRLSLTLTNRGLAPVRGNGRFAVTPPDEISVEEDAQFSFDLPPGAHCVHVITATLADTAEQVVITACGDDETFPLIGQCLLCQRDLTIPRIATIDDVQAVAVGLAEVPLRALRSRGQTIGELRMAMTGDYLAVRLDVIEHHLKVNPEMPWLGSSIELFCETDTTHLKVQQYILYPADDTHAPGALRTDHLESKMFPETGIVVRSTRTADGYTLSALVPLSLLFLSPEVSAFHFDLSLNTTLHAGWGAVQAKLFGASFSWMGMDSWGTVHIAPPSHLTEVPACSHDC